jgi:ssRNA-specific RNase YbeY (16S rRNA maturation enzyme)
MPNTKNEKIEQLKQEIDNWVDEFTKSQKRFDRFDVYEGEQLSLGFLAYKDDKGQTTVLISIHGQKPTNSLSFPANALEDIKQITRTLEKYEELFRYIEKYEENVKSVKKKKNLLE